MSIRLKSLILTIGFLLLFISWYISASACLLTLFASLCFYTAFKDLPDET